MYRHNYYIQFKVNSDLLLSVDIKIKDSLWCYKIAKSLVIFRTIHIFTGLFPNHVNIICRAFNLSKRFKVAKHFMSCGFTKDTFQEVGKCAQAQGAVGKTELAVVTE